MEDIIMKKQCLLSLVLLLSSSCAQNICAMQGQRDLVAELRNPTTIRIASQSDDALDEECSICFENMEFGDQNNIRARLECNHKFHFSCIDNERVRGQSCPICRGPIDYKEDFPDLTSAVKAQLVEPMQFIPVAQSTRRVEPLQQFTQPVQTERHIQLNERQHKILEDLIDQGLSNNLASKHIQLMCSAYSNPLVLADSDFMAVLTQAQRTLVQEFIDCALDSQDVRRPEREHMVYPGLNEQERVLLMQLVDGLKNLQRDDLDTVLIEAYTNPYVLAQSPVLTAVLTNEQKALVDYLLDCYTRRITQEV